MKNKIFNSQQQAPFGALTAVLLLSMVMLTTNDVSQNSVQAQTSMLLPSHLPPQDSTSTSNTPASEPSSNKDDLPSSSDSDDGTSTANSAPISPAPETPNNDDESDDNSNNSNNNDDSGTDDGSDDSDSQDTSSSDDDNDSESQEETDETEQTNPLLQHIQGIVSGALSANGMAVP